MICSVAIRFCRKKFVVFNLTQITSKPTRGSSFLDIIFISSHFVYNEVNNLSSMRDANHDVQLYSFSIADRETYNDPTSSIDHNKLFCELQRIDWFNAFMSYESTDDN